MATSVPPLQWSPAGVVAPSDAAILAGVQTDWNSACGGNLNPALNTAQGQLASSETAIISDKNSDILYFVSQVDPQYAEGQFQDAIARIYYLTRKPATSTAVTCDLGGLPGTSIPAGTFALDTSNNKYVLLGTVQIGPNSTITSSWQNVATGPIACPEGTLTRVYQSIPGWDSINNPADGVLGQNVESRAQFEYRRQMSVAVNGVGTVDAIQGDVFQVANTLDCFVVDNPSGNTVDYGATNYPLAPHSVFVAVVGGVDQLVANAIWGKKDVGCDYNGNTTETVIDNSGNYAYPQPSYQVKFERPTALPIYFTVNIVNTGALPSNIATEIQNAIVNQFTGQSDMLRARIGSLIIAAQYYASVSAADSTIVLLSIYVGTSANPDESDVTVDVGIDQTPTINASNIAVNLI